MSLIPLAPLSRRSVLAGGAGLFALTALPGLSRAGGDLAGVTLRAAKYKGREDNLLRAAGQFDTPYAVTFGEFASGNVIVEAMNAGAVDVGSMSEIPPVFAAVSGARIKAVAIIADDVNNQVILVPKDSPIRTPADLAGRRVGYVRATTTQYYLARILKAAGLSFADITGVALTPADGRAAFDQGAIDAWAIYGYSVPITIAASGARVLITANGYLSGNYIYAAREDALADPKLSAAIGDYLLRIKRAWAWQQAHLEDWATIFSGAIGVPRDIVLGQLRNASQPNDLRPVTDDAVASVQAVADTFIELGLVPGPIDVAPLFDRRYGELLAKSA